jgi:hypothetical protein
MHGTVLLLKNNRGASTMILAQGKTSPLMCMLLVFFQYDVIHKTRLIRIESNIGRKKKGEKS